MHSHSLLQGIFPTQGSNPGLPHCRQIVYHLSHQESPISDNKRKLLSFNIILFYNIWASQVVLVVKNPLASPHKRHRFDPWVGKISCSGRCHPTPVFWPGKFHGQKILVGYSPWGCRELDMIEQLSTQHSSICLLLLCSFFRVAHKIIGEADVG